MYTFCLGRLDGGVIEMIENSKLQNITVFNTLIISGFRRFSEIAIKPGHIFEKMTWGRGDQKMSTFHDSQNQNPKFVYMYTCM